MSLVRTGTSFFTQSHLRLLVAGLMAMAVIAAITTFAGKPGGTGPVSPFVKVGTHPQAAVQTSAAGKEIVTLKSWNGKLYAGFGDYGTNTGPITVNAFDGTNFASTLPREQLPRCDQGITTPEACTADTEAIYLFHDFAGRLYGSSIDPKGNNSNYTFGTPAGPGTASWQNPAGFAEHAFDVAKLTPNDLWVVGSKYDEWGGVQAAAWRSLDDGATWTESLSLFPADRSLTCGSYPNFARFYGAGTFNGKLYLHAYDCASGEQPTSKVFDSATNSWSDGPSIGAFNHAEIFAGKMVFQTGFHAGDSAGSLGAFDGAAVVYPAGVGKIWNYTIDGGTIYALGTDYSIKKSTDLATWTNVANAPSTARSITIHNGAIYLGTTDSSIYRLPLSTPSPTATADAPDPNGDTVQPVATISEPAPDATVSGRVYVRATATDDVAVAKMQVYIDGLLKSTSAGSSITHRWSTGKVPSGLHTITVKAHDAAGNVGETSITVRK